MHGYVYVTIIIPTICSAQAISRGLALAGSQFQLCAAHKVLVHSAYQPLLYWHQTCTWTVCWNRTLFVPLRQSKCKSYSVVIQVCLRRRHQETSHSQRDLQESLIQLLVFRYNTKTSFKIGQVTRQKNSRDLFSRIIKPRWASHLRPGRKAPRWRHVGGTTLVPILQLQFPH